MAPALVVAHTAGLLADLVAIGLGEGAKARRRCDPRAHPIGQRRIGAEEVGDQIVDRDRRTLHFSPQLSSNVPLRWPTGTKHDRRIPGAGRGVTVARAQEGIEGWKDRHLSTPRRPSTTISSI